MKTKEIGLDTPGLVAEVMEVTAVFVCDGCGYRGDPFAARLAVGETFSTCACPKCEGLRTRLVVVDPND